METQLQYNGAVFFDLDHTRLNETRSSRHGANGSRLPTPDPLDVLELVGIEDVPVTGRRTDYAHEAASFLGTPSYISDAGCRLLIDGREILLTGEYSREGPTTVAEKVRLTGAPQLLLAAFPGRIEYYEPYCGDRQFDHMFRGTVTVEAVRRLLDEHGHEDLGFIDNGAAVGPDMDHWGQRVFHLLPKPASKEAAVGRYMSERGYEPEQVVMIGDSKADLNVASRVGRCFIVRNGVEDDPDLLAAIEAAPNVTVTEGRMGEGFHEAVFRWLRERLGSVASVARA